MAPRKILEKTLRKTDVSKRLSFPTKKLHLLPPFQNGLRGVDLEIEDEAGHVYPVRCTIRLQGHKKPVLSAGWTKVVRDLGLKAADEVTCFKLGAGHLKLQVKKKKENEEEEKTNGVGHHPADHHEEKNATVNPGNNDGKEVVNEISYQYGEEVLKEPIKVFGAVIGSLPARRPINLSGVVIGWADT